MSEKIPEYFPRTPDELKARARRENPLDHLYSLEGGVTIREQLEAARASVPDGSDEAELLDDTLNTAVAYLEAPDRYELSDVLSGIDNEAYRTIRTELQREQPETHKLLEQQRVRMNAINTLLLPLITARGLGLGDPFVRDGLQQRLEHITARIAAQEDSAAPDHRTMSDADKDAVVKDVSALARDIVIFVLRAVAPRES